MFLVCMESSKSPESSFLSNPKIYSYVILLKNKLVRACSLYSWLFSFHVCTIVYLWQCKTARMFIWKSTSSYVFSVGFTFNHWLDFRFTSLLQQHSNIIHYYWVLINLLFILLLSSFLIIHYYFLFPTQYYHYHYHYHSPSPPTWLWSIISYNSCLYFSEIGCWCWYLICRSKRSESLFCYQFLRGDDDGWNFQRKRKILSGSYSPCLCLSGLYQVSTTRERSFLRQLLHIIDMFLMFCIFISWNLVGISGEDFFTVCIHIIGELNTQYYVDWSSSILWVK